MQFLLTVSCRQMKRILFLIGILACLGAVSCGDHRTSTAAPGVSPQDTIKIIPFGEIPLKCYGEQYSPDRCFNENEKISVALSKKSVSFVVNDVGYIDPAADDVCELGCQVFAYGNGSNKVIILDAFLEYGHLYVVYFYNATTLKYLGKKEITLTDKIAQPIKLQVGRIGDELEVSFQEGMEQFTFNLNQGKDLRDRDEIPLAELMEEHKGNPEYVTDNLIFTRDENHQLQINTEILSYIQRNSTAQDNAYVIALEKYVSHAIDGLYYSNEKQWTEAEMIKIIAYAANTTDPLHKKLWKESPEHWHNGMWGNILSYCYLVHGKTLWVKLQSQWEEEHDYNLPYLREMIAYAMEFDRFGPPG